MLTIDAKSPAPQFRGYAALINESTGEASPAIVAEIEECMRNVTGGCLDHISRTTFFNLARRCAPVARELLALSAARRAI